MKRTVGVVAVAVLVVLAGCSGANPLGGDSGTDAGETDAGEPETDADPGTSGDSAGDGGGASTPSDEGGSTTPTAASGAGSPPGMAGGDVRNASALRAAHLERLRALSSFSLSFEADGLEGYFQRIDVAVSNDRRAYAGTAESPSGTRQVAFANGTSYSRTDPNGSVETYDAEFADIHRTSIEFVAAVSNADLTAANTTTVAGRTVRTYRVTDFSTEGEMTVANASGRLQVTPDGLVVAFALTLTNATGTTVTQRYALDDLGTASVETPDWVERYDPAEDVSAPVVSLAVDFGEDGRATVTHESGEAVSSLTVRYTADGETVSETWNPDEEILAGVSYTTERAPDPGTEVVVVWSSGDQSVALVEADVPE